MLNESQSKYLQTLSDTEIVEGGPYDPRAAEVAKRLLKELQTAVPELEVFWGGALALGISGKNDIDLSIVSRCEDYDEYLPSLIRVLGEPQKRGLQNVRWEIVRDGYSVDVHLADERSEALAEQRKTHDLLKNNPELLKEYTKLKEDASGLSVREYQRHKYEFYNRILVHE
jgi:GrpB-like predicted nucleotidyltransferase (UPF0157 family)